MKWYEDLYVGDSIEGKVNRIKWKINHHAGTVSIYVIAFASNRQNLLDIIPAWELMQKSYPGKKEMQIIGLAKGYAVLGVITGVISFNGVIEAIVAAIIVYLVGLVLNTIKPIAAK